MTRSNAWKLVVTIASSIAFAVPLARADWPASGVRLATGPTQQLSPVGLTGPNGELHAFWVDAGPSPYALYSQHLTRQGTLVPGWPVGGRGVVAAPAAISTPKLILDGAGGAILAWYDYRASGVSRGIYAIRVDSEASIASGWVASGTPICTTSTPLGTGPLNDLTAVCSDGAGGAFVAWTDARNTPVMGTLVYDVFAHHVRFDGSLDPSWPVAGRGLTTGPGYKYPHALIADGSGGFWLASENSNATSLIAATHHGSDGTETSRWASPSFASRVIGASDETGGIFLAWRDCRDCGSGSDAIYAIRLGPTAAPRPGWPVGGVAIGASPGDDDLPVIVATGDGAAMIAWLVPGGALDAYVARRIEADGTFASAWQSGGRTFATSRDILSGWPLIAPDGDGGAMFAFRRNTPNLFGSRVNALAQVPAAFPDTGLSLCSLSGNQFPVSLVSDGVDGAYLLWQDHRDFVPNRSDVYAMHFTREGELGAGPINSSRVTVPDDFATIQLAIDSGADTVDVRTGTYPERLEVGQSLVLRGLPGSGQRPRANGLVTTSLNDLGQLRVRDFAFDGAVELRRAGYGNALVEIESCTLDSGLVQTDRFEFWDYAHVDIYRSRILGWVRTIATNFVVCDSDTFLTGGIRVAGDNPTMSVRDCRFEGTGYSAISQDDGGAMNVQTSEIIGSYEHGILADAGTILDAVENRITGCSSIGVLGHGSIRSNVVASCGIGINCYEGSVESNVVRDCGTGISGVARNVSDNLIVGSVTNGLRVQASRDVVIERNVVGRSGQDGIRVDFSGSNADASIVANTVFRNQGHGIHLVSTAWPQVVTKNIAFQNVGYGLSADTLDVPTTCNNWFGNGTGATRGMPSGASDLALDPLFCDVDADSVSLAEDSPLLDAPGCGLIGARGQGCASTPTLLTMFTAEREADGVRVRWSLAAGSLMADVRIERADAATGPWTIVVISSVTQGDALAGIDRSARAEQEYWYRLTSREGGEAVVISESVHVLKIVPYRFELTRVAPNPGFGPLMIRFTLAHEAVVELNVVDLQGRRVASLVNGTRSAGAHSVEWPGPLTAPGIYFVAYRFPGGDLVERIVRLR